MNPFNEHFAKYKEQGIEYLRANIPAIQKLESLDDLQDLRLVEEIDKDLILVLKYETTAPTLFPAVRQRLIDKDIAKRHNMLHTTIRNEGASNENYRVTMGFYGNTLQIFLSVYK